MFEDRMQQLMAERKNLNMRLAEINFLINGYETAIQDEKKNKKKNKKDEKADSSSDDS